MMNKVSVGDIRISNGGLYVVTCIKDSKVTCRVIDRESWDAIAGSDKTFDACELAGFRKVGEVDLKGGEQ